MSKIHVINQTMELSEVREKWFFDEKYQCWCLEDVLYTPKAVVPMFQRLSVFVPAPYMKQGGELDNKGTMNGYTAKTTPVIFNNNSAGYMQMPHMWLGGPRCRGQEYLERGFVYITCGNRGHESKDEEGNFCGKAPANLIDLKMAIRFLRHNAAYLPGDFERIVSVGWSAGGAMSALLAVTGNNKKYDPYLEEAGAFMEESDKVRAAQIYCPIVDMEHADMAYEWMFAADKENEDTPMHAGRVMAPFEEALSTKLRENYISYFNNLDLKNPKTGGRLVLGEDGRSGATYEYLMELLDRSASTYLGKLERKELSSDYTPEDYLSGNYSRRVPAPISHGEEEKPAGSPGESMTLGEMLCRPQEGETVPAPRTRPMMTVRGEDKRCWLSWDGEKARITDLDSYVLHQRRRKKPCPSFDTLTCDSGENKVFGDKKQPVVHFSQEVGRAIDSLRESFPEEYAAYHGQYAGIFSDETLLRQIYLINPMNFIGTDEKSDQASFYRIRVGASDADTSFTVSLALALKLAEEGYPVDYELVWEQPHAEADYSGEFCDWICGIFPSRM